MAIFCLHTLKMHSLQISGRRKNVFGSLENRLQAKISWKKNKNKNQLIEKVREWEINLIRKSVTIVPIVNPANTYKKKLTSKFTGQMDNVKNEAWNHGIRRNAQEFRIWSMAKQQQQQKKKTEKEKERRKKNALHLPDCEPRTDCTPVLDSHDHFLFTLKY